MKVVLENGKKRTAYGLGLHYKFKKSANAIGSNNFVNSQWWPNRLPTETGHMVRSKQVFWAKLAIFVSTGGYADDDQGQVSY